MEAEPRTIPGAITRIAYIHLRPFVFHALANDFLKAAEGLQTKSDSPVHYFLYCRSIELSLKAFLLAKNVPVSKIRNPKWIGHDLERALEECELRGLPDIVEIRREYKEELRKGNHYYKSKQGFEYAEDYEVLMRFGGVMPRRKVLRELASTLVAKLDGVCFECVHSLLEKSGGKELHRKDQSRRL
jgi:HEPN domain-containing protein